MRRRKARGSDPAYRSPQEIALQNAADSLGVDLGEYYPHDQDFLEGLGDDVEGTGRLDASREELLAYIEGRKARRWRKRRARALWVLATCLLVVASVALVADPERLGLSRGGSDVSMRDQSQDFRPRPLSGYGPQRGVPELIRTSVSTSLSSGGDKVTYVAYVDRFGDVCPTFSFVDGGITRQPSGGGCSRLGLIAKALSSKPAVLMGSSGGDTYFQVQGYARPDLRRLLVRGRMRGVKVAISRAWTPGKIGRDKAVSLKTFLVHIPFNLASDPLAGERALQEGSLQLLGELSDGRLLRVEGMQEFLDRRESRSGAGPVG